MDAKIAINRIKSCCKSQISTDVLNDLEKLCEEFTPSEIYSRAKLFSSQIEFGLIDLYARYCSIKSELHPKDSSSLRSFCLKYGEVEGSKMWEEKINKTKCTLENMISRYGQEEGEIRYKEASKKKSYSLENCIRRFGEVEGRLKYKEYWENTNFSVSLPAFIRRHGEVLGKELYNAQNTQLGFYHTLEGYIEKYGIEEGTKRYYDRNTKRSKSQSKISFVKKLLENGFSTDEILLKIEKRWKRTPKGFIDKYGEEEGIQRYNNWIQNVKENNMITKEYYLKRGFDEETALELAYEASIARWPTSVSKKSLKTILPIILELENVLNESGYYGETEYRISLTKLERQFTKNKSFLYDFTFKNAKIMIEYHGGRFHEDLDYDLTKYLVFEDFRKEFKFDLYKKWIAENRGFSVFIVREWNLSKDLLKLREWLNERGLSICQELFF